MKKSAYFLPLLFFASSVRADSLSMKIKELTKKSIIENNYSKLCQQGGKAAAQDGDFKVLFFQRKSSSCSLRLEAKVFHESQNLVESDLQIYPKIENTFVLASFKNVQSKRLQFLPRDLKSFVVKKVSEAKKLATTTGEYPSEIQVSAKNLKKIFPDWVKMTFTAFSTKGSVAVKPTSLTLVPFTDAGQLQLKATFSNVPKETIFILAGEANNMKVELIPNGAKEGILGTSQNIIKIETPSGLTYYATIDSTERDFALIWDEKNSSLKFLSASEGQSWGNERNNQDKTYKIILGEKAYILRNTSRSSELLLIEKEGFRHEVIADLRSPEI